MEFRSNVKRILSFFSFLGFTLTCLLFTAFLPLLYIGLSEEFSFTWLKFESLAPWLALPSAVIGFVLSRFFTKKKEKRFFTRTFLLFLGLWVFSLLYVGPISYLGRIADFFTSCRSKRYIEESGGNWRLAIYVLAPPLASGGILVRNEKKVFPFVLKVRRLFWDEASLAEVKKVEGSRYEVKISNYYKKPPSLVGRIVWP